MSKRRGMNRENKISKAEWPPNFRNRFAKNPFATSGCLAFVVAELTISIEPITYNVLNMHARRNTMPINNVIDYMHKFFFVKN